jgi:hypothetical protein
MEEAHGLLGNNKHFGVALEVLLIGDVLVLQQTELK